MISTFIIRKYCKGCLHDFGGRKHPALEQDFPSADKAFPVNLARLVHAPLTCKSSENAQIRVHLVNTAPSLVSGGRGRVAHRVTAIFYKVERPVSSYRCLIGYLLRYVGWTCGVLLIRFCSRLAYESTLFIRRSANELSMKGINLFVR